MITVWICFLFLGGGSSAVVDNIATEQDCKALISTLDTKFKGRSMCAAVRKVAP